MKKLKITMNDYEVYAKLHYDKAPKLIAAIEKASPIIALVRHARCCENEWMLSTPYFDVEDENFSYPVPGDISLHRSGPHFCGWYDNFKPLGTTDIFATVSQNDLSEYKHRMRTVWRHPGEKMKIEIVEVDV